MQLPSDEAFLALYEDHKRTYERTRSAANCKLKAPYDEIYGEFDAGRSPAELALVYNVSRPTMQKAYAIHFAPMLGSRYDIAARQKSTCSCWSIRETKLVTASPDDPLLLLARRLCEEQGKRLDNLKRPKAQTTHRVAHINGRSCRIMFGDHILESGANGGSYIRFTINRASLHEVEFQMFILGENGRGHVFIIPTRILLKRQPHPDQQFQVCVPLSRSTIKAGYARIKPINFYRYKDAWHLFGI